MTEAICLLAATICLVFFNGCTPPGPRSLLQGKKLMDAGDYAGAVEKLEAATRLLPNNPLAWNYLGLAYHSSGQSEAAARAYRTCLALDHKLSVVRYNLGCLYLEANNLPAASEELKSFTLLQPGSVEGWAKLGAAQLRARRIDEAEKSFRTALELQGNNTDALNGLGLIQVHRRRWQDALAHFNSALTHDPSYAPALLNAAVVQHQYLNARTLALQRYRDYLALHPRPAEWEAVSATVRQLEADLAPAPPATRTAVASSTPAIVSARTNTVASTIASTPPPRLTAVAPPATNPVRTNVSSTSGVVRSNTSSVPAGASSPPAVAKAPPADPVRNVVRPASNKTAEVAVPKPVEIEVTRVPSELVVRPAQDLTRISGMAASNTVGVVEPPVDDRMATNSSRRSIFSRWNPFSGRSKTETEKNASPTTPPARPVTGSSTVPRYSYLSPPAPTSGNRAEAEKYFKRGLQAYRERGRTLAIKEYQAAVKADPAYYDAYYNLGLAALDNGNTALSLWAYEIALALKPEAEDARYNFALALKAGGYWFDAIDQLERLVKGDSTEDRAHLSMANLYSQQLQQPDRARAHYQRVLELNPRHPDAAKIRYWLASNP